jgi:hypothetical protein
MTSREFLIFNPTSPLTSPDSSISNRSISSASASAATTSYKNQNQYVDDLSIGSVENMNINSNNNNNNTTQQYRHPHNNTNPSIKSNHSVHHQQSSSSTPHSRQSSIKNTTVTPMNMTMPMNMNMSSSSSNNKAHIGEYRLGKELGKGSYGEVVLGHKIYDNKEYAIKICNKLFIIHHNKQQQVLKEKRILTLVDGHTNIIRLYHTFQDNDSLYFVMEYAGDGEMYEEIRTVGRYSYEYIQFYAAELILALEYIHKHNVVHRDIKPVRTLSG